MRARGRRFAAAAHPRLPPKARNEWARPNASKVNRGPLAAPCHATRLRSIRMRTPRPIAARGPWRQPVSPSFHTCATPSFSNMDCKVHPTATARSVVRLGPRFQSPLLRAGPAHRRLCTGPLHTSSSASTLHQPPRPHYPRDWCPDGIILPANAVLGPDIRPREKLSEHSPVALRLARYRRLSNTQRMLSAINKHGHGFRMIPILRRPVRHSGGRLGQVCHAAQHPSASGACGPSGSMRFVVFPRVAAVPMFV